MSKVIRQCLRILSIHVILIRMRGGRMGTAFGFIAFVTESALCSGRSLRPHVSTTVFGGDGRHHQPPLAVLRRSASSDGEASSLAELQIHAEDPDWASKVEDFMAANGADAQGVESALDGVRHVSWSAGRTFRSKHAVLVAFADDTQSDGEGNPLCRLTRAILGASKHTTDAHFILVADGFDLDAKTRESVEGMLDEEGWRSFTAIEVPEFEGSSSAINRAMKSVEGSSVVAVLSTSTLLLPANRNKEGGTDPGGALNDVSSEGAAGDVFVAYERMLSSASKNAPSLTLDKAIPSLESMKGASGRFGRRYDDRYPYARDGRAKYDPYGHSRLGESFSNDWEGLLVTSSPSRSTTFRHRDGHKNVNATPSTGKHGANGLFPAEKNSEQDQDRLLEAEAEGPLQMTVGRPPPKSSRRPPVMRLSDAAALPLLVFDTETFFALGDFDERFTFQGGIAEWMSRTKIVSSNEGMSAINAETGGYHCCHTSTLPHRGSPRKMGGATGYGAFEGYSCSDVAVRHIHEYEWSKRFMRSLPDGHGSTESAVPAKRSTDEQSILEVGTPGKDQRSRDEAQQDEITDRELQHDGGGDFSGQTYDFGHSWPKKEVTLDQWNKLPPVELEGWIQKDADLFFLNLLLSRRPPDLRSTRETDEIEYCIAFHSEWMERVPDKILVQDALDRRERFPVAVVVVVHDDISLMRATLEEVATVVEHILVVVSLTPWNGETVDVSPTLELLNDMLEDVGSPTQGKLRVEVGSWATEPEQREHGNALIREDARDFFRVVIMDTDEFWHPVELTKALVLATRQPEAGFLKAEMDTYWASVRSVVSPPEELQALWLVDHRRCVWDHYRAVECEIKKGREHLVSFTLDKSVAFVHHLSYVRVEEDLRRKMRTFSHAGEEKSGWYSERWLGWRANNSLTDLHPVFPEAFKRVVVQPLFRLTPALRILHQDAKKGNRPEGETHSKWKIARSEGNYTGVHSSGGNPVHPQRDFEGCERNHVSQWTELQRTMCHIPDAGSWAVHQ